MSREEYELSEQAYYDDLLIRNIDAPEINDIKTNIEIEGEVF